MSPTGNVSMACEKKMPRTYIGRTLDPLPAPAECPALASGGASLPALADDPRGAITRLFGARVINDGTGMIKLGAPSTVQRSAEVPVSVEVNWWLVLAKAVAHLYLVADGNDHAVLARVALIPVVVPPHPYFKISLDRSTHLHAVVECGDGTLLQVSRWIRVKPAAVRGETLPLAE
jgi:predicted secreted protein